MMDRRGFGAGALAVLLVFTICGSAAVGAVSPTARPTGKPRPPFTASFFGMSMGADLTLLSDAKFDFEMNTMKKMGVHWVRALVPWSLVEMHDPSHDDWVLVDRLVQTVQEEGMQLDAIIESAPKWAQASPPAIPGCALSPPFDLQAFSDFSAKVAARYTSTQISAIEVENSPNLTGTNWPTPDPCAYTELMKRVYNAVKGVDSNILVVNGGVGGTKGDSGTIPGDTWIAALYANGVQGYLDAVVYKPYSYPCIPSAGCPTRPWAHLVNVRQTMLDNGDGAKQIWAGEFGAPTNGTPGDGHVDEATQSSMLLDGMQQWAALSYTGPFFAYEFRDYGTDPTDKSDWFGLVSNDLRHKKPAFFTYAYQATGRPKPPIPARDSRGVRRSTKP